MPAAQRIYAIKPLDGASIKPRLVLAATPAAALRHVVSNTMTVAVASQRELVELVGAGTQVEEAHADE